MPSTPGSRNIFAVLDETATRLGSRTALAQPMPGSKRSAAAQHHIYTWTEFRDAAREIAVGLSECGVHHGDIVAIHSETRAEFFLADLGVMALGAIAAALYTAIPMSEQAGNIQKAKPKAIFMESPKTMKSLVTALGDLHPHTVWILLTGEDEDALTLDALRAKGREKLVTDPESFKRLHAQVKPEDPAILYLTSGATGAPKMGIVTHGAAVANLDMGPGALPAGPDDKVIAFLPSAHIAQRVAMELLSVRMGFQVYFSESLARLPIELKHIKPTVLLAPPRVWEDVRDHRH